MDRVAFLLPGWGTPAIRLQPTADALAEAGTEARLWRYAPSGSLTALIDALAGAIASVDAEVHLVGHSLGGIVAAAAALRDTEARVASVTTINAPWRGTWLGYTGSSNLARQLRWGSDDLRELRRDLARHLNRPEGPSWRVIAMYGDLGTPPSTAAATPGGPRLSRVLLPLWGHSVSLLAPRLAEEVVDHVSTASAIRHAA